MGAGGRGQASAQSAQNSCGSLRTGNQCWRVQQQALLLAGSTWTTQRALQDALNHHVVTAKVKQMSPEHLVVVLVPPSICGSR